MKRDMMSILRDLEEGKNPDLEVEVKEGTKVGYARVSTTGQKLDVQLDKLNDYGCTEYFTDKKSGTDEDREALRDCLRYVRKGDALVITRLDRLARNTFHLTRIARQLEEKGVELIVLDQNIDTTTPTGKLMFDVLASIAEFETALRGERQAEGIAKAKENGVKFGAKKKLSTEQLAEMVQLREEGGVRIKDLAATFGISKASVYRLMNEYKNM
jgi:DNA invertase Pin-like site-specific DNA recombinase